MPYGLDNFNELLFTGIIFTAATYLQQVNYFKERKIWRRHSMFCSRLASPIYGNKIVLTDFTLTFLQQAQTPVVKFGDALPLRRLYPV